MRKKLTRIFLVLAVVAVGASSVTSCKDTNDDIYAEIEAKNGDIDAAVEEQINALNEIKGNLQDQVDSLAQVTENLDEVSKQDQKDFTADLNALKHTIDSLIVEHNNSIIDINGKIANLVSVMQADYATKVCVTIQINTAISEIRGGYEGSMKDLYDLIQANKTDIASNLSKINANADSIAANKAAIEDLQGWVANFDATFGIFVENLQQVMDQYEQNFTNINNQLVTLTEDLNKATETAAYAFALAKADSTRLDALTKDLNDYKAANDKRVGDLEDLLEQYNGETNARIDSLAAACTANLKKAKDYANELYNDVLAKMIEQDAQTYNDAVAYTDAKMADLKAAIDELQQQIDKNTAAIAALDGRLNKLVTGIIVQGTQSPVLGMALTPIANVNLLAAYLGHTSEAVGFPSNRAADFVFADQAANVPADICNKTVVDEENGYVYDHATGNAGKLYLTINPNTVDFTNLTVSLVNSRGEQAKGFDPIVLSPSDKLLQFGWTRDGSAEGFYEADVTMSDPAKAKLSVDKAQLKSVAREALNALKGQGNINLMSWASSIFGQFNNKLDAYAAQVKWTDTHDGVEKEHKVTSQYNVAATAINPLSFAFLKNGQSRYQLPNIPTLDAAGLHFEHFNYDPVQLSGTKKVGVTVSIPDLDNYSPNVTVDMSGVTVTGVQLSGDPVAVIKFYDANGQECDIKNAEDAKVFVDISNVGVGTPTISGSPVVTVDMTNITYKDETYYADIDMAMFQDLIDQLNDQVGGMIGKVNDMIDMVNGKVEAIDSRFISRANNVINRINKVITNPNTYLQPTLFYNTVGGGLQQAPTVREAAVKVSKAGGDAIQLYPTSYTLEMLAPAMKKYIQVKHNGQIVSGRNINEVISGSVHTCAFNVEGNGIYEVLYTAIDFDGKVAARTYYFNVVD